MSGGTLDADKTLTVSGALSQSGNIDDRRKASGKTLTYSGAAAQPGSKDPDPERRRNTEQHKCLCVESRQQQAPAELNYSCQSKHITGKQFRS